MAKKKTVEKKEDKKTCDVVAVLADVINAIEKIEFGSDKERVLISAAAYFGLKIDDGD